MAFHIAVEGTSLLHSAQAAALGLLGPGSSSGDDKKCQILRMSWGESPVPGVLGVENSVRQQPECRELS